MSESTAAPARPTTDDADAWNAYWQAQGMGWRTEPEIPPDRQAYLVERRAITPDIEQGVYPFRGVKPMLARADIEWLLATHDNGHGPVVWADEKNKHWLQRRRGLDLRGAVLRELNLRGLPLTRLQGGLDGDGWLLATPEQRLQAATDLGGANLEEARLEGAFLLGTQLAGARLIEAHLEQVDLREAQLADANLVGVHLEDAALEEAHLERAYLNEAQMEGANFRGAHLEHASLFQARLESASLIVAHLEGAGLHGAYLEGADLYGAHLEGANLRLAQLEQASLRSGRLDRETRLNGAQLAGVSLDQVVFDNTNLTVVSWEGVAPLGDERRARAARHGEYLGESTGKGRRERIGDYEAAVRANRLLATALRAQGLAEDGDIFAYRAQLMQRGLRFQRRQFGRWLVSWGLAALSGYGYRLGRIFAAYAIAVLTFAALFLLPTFLDGAVPTIQQAADALQISLNAIHGRVFFAQFHLDTLQSWLATAESVIGIVIEGVFVAMIIQRLFR
jgi:uncharacterized protein YjbI with pentapeptide repeats